MEPEASLLCLQELATEPYPEPDAISPRYIPKICSHIISHLRLRLPVVSSFQVFRPEFFMYVSPLPCVLHAPSVLSS
jgi:hypothetical protein